MSDDPETERLRRELEKIINTKPEPPPDERYKVFPDDPPRIFEEGSYTPPPSSPPAAPSEPDIWSRPRAPKPKGFFQSLRTFFRALLNKATRT